MTFSRTTKNMRGRATDDTRPFVESALVSVSNSPDKLINYPIIYQFSKAYNILMKTIYIHGKTCKMKRKLILDGKLSDYDILWYHVKRRNYFSNSKLNISKAEVMLGLTTFISCFLFYVFFLRKDTGGGWCEYSHPLVNPIIGFGDPEMRGDG